MKNTKPNMHQANSSFQQLHQTNDPYAKKEKSHHLHAQIYTFTWIHSCSKKNVAMIGRPWLKKSYRRYRLIDPQDRLTIMPKASSFRSSNLGRLRKIQPQDQQDNLDQKTNRPK